LKLKIVEALCEPGATHNEDAWGGSGDAIWVLDGATGVVASPHLSSPSDAAWFAGQISSALSDELASAPPSTIGAIAAAAARAAEAARGIRDIDALPIFELPCASLALVRGMDGGRLEFANLGDCRLIWRAGDGPVQAFGTCGVAELDARLDAQIARDLARGLSPEAVRLAAKALAREHRKLINTREGYWILDLSGAGVPHLEVEARHPEGPVELMLMSDGFYRLLELYRTHDYDGLMREAREAGLVALHDRLRAIEAADPECRAYPRNKPRDDATAVLLRYE
jgi:hypothetical protein